MLTHLIFTPMFCGLFILILPSPCKIHVLVLFFFVVLIFFWKQCWIAEFVLKFTINPSKNFVDHLSSGLLLVTVHCSYIYNYSPAKNINVGLYTTKKYIPNQVYHNYLNFNKNYTRNIYFSMAQMKTDSKK